MITAKPKISVLAVIAAVLAGLQVLLAAGKFIRVPVTITEVGFLGILTLIFSAIAFFRIRKSRGALRGNGLAIFGLIVSGLSMLLLIVMAVVISGMER